MALTKANPHRQRTLASRHREARGVSANRAAYDVRRRRSRDSHDTQVFRALLRMDPCSACGVRPYAERPEANAADHIVPLSAGGIDDWTNMTALCRPCNASKKAKPLLHWMLEAA